MKRTLSVLFVAVVALLSLLGTATAEPGASAGPDVLINTPVTLQMPVQHDVSPQALSCPSGNLCVWPVSDGSRNRCSWVNADNDWQTGTVTCSWSSSSAVWAVYNHGTSSSYIGVCLYTGANYGGHAYFASQGQQVPGFPGARLRSHKWITGATGC
jgi:peptidase inhibitor family I36